jgi:hypothetical protein
VNATITRATHEYLTRVRTALADIPVAEVEDLLDDVRPHLTDIAAEIGPDCTLKDMIERLGTPEQYAAELRAAGDYPPAPSSSPSRVTRRPRLALWTMLLASFALFWCAAAAVADTEAEMVYGMLFFGSFIGVSAFVLARRGDQSLDELGEVVWLRNLRDSPTGRYFRSLAPGWWIGAALIFIAVALVLIQHDPWGIATVLPFYAIFAGLIVFAGHRVSQQRLWMWATVPLSAMAIGSVIGGLGVLSTAGVNDRFGGEFGLLPGLFNDGQPVSNVFGFTKDGQPIGEFYLVDQNGQPLNVVSESCNGAVSRADNRFPKTVVRHDEQGECTETNETPFTIAIPQSSTPAPTTTTTPAPTTTVEPTPTP